MIDVSQINYKSPTFHKIAGTVVLFFVIFFLWHSQSYSANKETIMRKSEELESILSRIEQAKQNAARAEEVKAELERLFAQYKLIEELLPRERDIPTFINMIQLAAKQADARILNLEQKPSQVGTYYTADPYRLKLHTTYHGLGKFLSLVANLPFTALVKNINMNKLNAKKYSVDVSLTVVAHHLPSESRPKEVKELLKKKGKGPGQKKKPKKKAKKVPS